MARYRLAYGCGGHAKSRQEPPAEVEVDQDKAERVNAKLPKPLYIPVEAKGKPRQPGLDMQQGEATSKPKKKG